MAGERTTDNQARILNPAALALLMAANLVLSISQFNIASLFFLIGPSFGQGVPGLGFLTSSFYLAYGLFEVPGGILAAKVGPKKVTLAGTIFQAAAVVASSASPSFPVLAGLRFAAGLGFSFVFPSSLVLIVRYYRRGAEGFGVGLMTFSSFLGGAIGLFGWSVLGAATGWRPSVLVNGLLCLGVGIAMIFVLPPDAQSSGSALKLSDLRKVVFNRTLLVLCVTIFGIASTSGLASNFLVFYLEGHLGVVPSVAGLIGGLGIALPLFSGPIAGRVYDRLRNPKVLIIVSSVAIAIGVSLAALGTVYAAVLSAIIEGISSGVAFTAILSLARQASARSPQFESFSIAWVDSFSLYGNVASPIYFSALVVAQGYSVAWLVGGLVAIALAVPLILSNRSLLVQGRVDAP